MKKIFFVVLLLVSFPAAALEKLNMQLKYKAYWSGITMGEMKIYLKTEGEKYDYKVRLDSHGFTKMITKYWSENRAVGKMSDEKYIPQNYYTEWRLKKERQKICVNFDANGDAIEEVAVPPENRGKRSFVELKDKKNSYDTITAAAVAREHIIEAATKNKFPAKISVPLFDARRKQDIVLTIHGYESKKIDGKKHKVLHVSFVRIPGAGFRPKELKRMESQEPKYDLYLNENFIPLLVVGTAPVGTATILLEEICKTADCALGNE